ncbi:Protein of unknown function [Bacillus cereus]|uniref:Uncharacterized protein n=1 Tax=Bacillus wiedmannii TaxID=1890302 RepID=A0AB37YY78_9BACI|nr:Protein of unknown function [Bacillus wiedmannii]SCC64038.1 Protein of unknown function [Bacillus cereus]SCN39432.1 Protein of unknown function [Bacillus wiedmannii]
MGTWLCTKV